jgi:hypothetical protein
MYVAYHMTLIRPSLVEMELSVLFYISTQIDYSLYYSFSADNLRRAWAQVFDKHKK